MIAVATNLNYICNNQIIVDSDYGKQFKFEIVKQQDGRPDQNVYPFDHNPIAIVLDNGYRNLKLSLSKQEASELIRQLTLVM